MFLDEVVTYLPSVLRLLYQITELMFNLDLEEDVDMDMLPEVISSLIQILASLVKKHPHQAQIVSSVYYHLFWLSQLTSTPSTDSSAYWVIIRAFPIEWIRGAAPRCFIP